MSNIGWSAREQELSGESKYCEELSKYLDQTNKWDNKKCRDESVHTNSEVLTPAVTAAFALLLATVVRVVLRHKTKGDGLVSDLAQLAEAGTSRPLALLLFTLVVSIVSLQISGALAEKFVQRNCP